MCEEDREAGCALRCEDSVAFKEEVVNGKQKPTPMHTIADG